MDPLIKFTSPKIQFVWSADYDKIFKEVQKVFSPELSLSFLDWSKQFYMNTDASGTAIVGVLLKEKTTTFSQ